MAKENNNIFPSIMQTIYLLILFLLSFIVITVIQRVLSGGISSDNSLFELCRTLVAAGITLFSAYLMGKKNGKRFTLPFKRVDAKICFWMILIAPLFFFFVLGVVVLVSMLFDSPPDKSIRPADVYTFISIVCVTPLFEELLFRGIILDGFLRRYSFFKAMLLSVFFFTMLHFGLQMLTAMLLGLLTGYVYYYTKSLWPGIILHGVNNLCALLPLYLTDDTSSETLNYFQSIEEIISTIGVLWILNAIVLLLILCHFFQLLKLKTNSDII